jgi:hypothetical protein
MFRALRKSIDGIFHPIGLERLESTERLMMRGNLSSSHKRKGE